MHIFVIDLTYIVPLEAVELHIEAHRAYLAAQYDAGHFLASGPKVPREGGVILAKGASRSAIEALVALDPFKIEGVAEYRVTEFIPRMTVEGFPFD